jgi:hypothetical protein
VFLKKKEILVSVYSYSTRFGVTIFS